MAKKSDVALPDLSNATPMFLVDELGKVRAEAGRLKTLNEYLGAGLKARLADTDIQYAGEKYVMTRSRFNQRKFNQEKALEIILALAPERVEECWKDTVVEQMRFAEKE